MGDTSWTKVEVEVGPGVIEAVANFLIELGSPGLELGEGKENHTIRAYLPDGTSEPTDLIERYLSDLGEMGFDVRRHQIRASPLFSTDWLSAWRERFRPIRIGRRLLIKPSWLEGVEESNRMTIVIDPQMAFGTGEHPTTQFCLCALENLLRRADAVLDLGTGSGIVAIAAAKLGAGQVLGLDIDPQAIATARENARINGVSHQVNFSTGEIHGLPEAEYHQVVANIDGHTLLPLLPGLKRVIKRQGHLILAGFLIREKGSLQRQCVRAGLQLEHLEQQGEWVSAIVRTL